MKRQRSGVSESVAPAKRIKCKGLKDPSLQFIAAPTNTPIIECARAWFKALKAPFEVHLGPIHGWRSIAKLAVRGTTASGQRILKDQCIGLFLQGTHKITPCHDSPVHHPSINAAARLVESCCVAHCVSGYREDTSTGLLRYIILAVEMSSGKVQVTLVCNCDPQRTSQSDQVMISKLVQALASEDALMHSIWVHSHPASRHDNAITGRLDNSWRCDFGDPHLRICMELSQAEGAEAKIRPQLCFPPNVFRQANLAGFARIIDTIRRYIPAKSKVIELYGGVGTIGLNCLDRVKKLHCSDENPYNVECFDACVDDLVAATGKRKYRQRATYLNASASERAQQGSFADYDLLIVDPPRKGLDDEVVVELLCPSLRVGQENRLQRLVYVSCGFKGFQNDCTRLLEGGRAWRLVHAEGHVLFPGSDHIETLAIFDRCRAGKK